MNNDITIPPEALEAAKDAWYAHQHMGTDDRMTAACLAMLKAWPERTSTVQPTYDNDTREWNTRRAIILPLPQENTNAEG